MISTSFDTIIIGGGAAGLMCAIHAASSGSVLIIEHAERCGKKILISGGGRCNFTNRTVLPQNFISQNPHFCKSALARFTPNDFLALVEKHNILYHEKKLGQLFCNDSSKQILAMLLDECAHAKVKILLRCEVQAISEDNRFLVSTSHGLFTAKKALVIATGGLSVPKMGASDFGLRVAKQFGLPIITPRPALVPMTYSSYDKSAFERLAGVSLDTICSVHTVNFRENILFTHRGISGPAMLQASSYHSHKQTITINLLPDISIENELNSHRNSSAELKNFLAEYFPKRFAEAWCDYLNIKKQISHLSKADIQTIANAIHQWKWSPNGNEGFDKAEVTAGGVDTNALSSKTLESNTIKGLFFIGEVVDVTGWLGGYNFQWAWASGAAAGRG
jgi:predicted Rossmann fold flavoprotein